MLRSVARVVMPLVYVVGLLLSPSVWAAHVRYVIEPVVEMTVPQLPNGPLYWRVESFPTLNQAKAATSEYRWNPDRVSYDGRPSMTADVDRKAWLFTLGQKGSVETGHTMNGHMAGVPMEVFSAGKTGLNALIMFVVDADKPFSSPAEFD